MSASPDDFNRLVGASLSNPLERYISYLKNERGYSKHTLSTYLHPLRSLCTEISKQGVNDWASVDEAHLRNWLINFKKANLKPTTIQNKVSACKGFFKFLLQRNIINIDPSQLLSAPKSGRPLPKNMSVDEVSGLLAFEPSAPIEFRDKAIMELFYSSGLRLSELASLDLSSIDLVEQEVRVLGKGNRERVVPVGRLAAISIKAWLDNKTDFVKATMDPNALFLSQLGNRLSTRQIAQRLKYWATKQGLSADLHPHKFRHSFASHVLESSSDLRAVQELLGHQNLSTTQIYTHLDYQHLASVYDKAHPRAKKPSK